MHLQAQELYSQPDTWPQYSEQIMDGLLGLPRTRTVSATRRSTERNLLTLTDWTQTWDGYNSRLDIISESQRNYFVFSEDCTAEVTCPAVKDLNKPACAGDSCIPCFVGHAIKAQQKQAAAHVDRVMQSWHFILAQRPPPTDPCKCTGHTDPISHTGMMPLHRRIFDMLLNSLLEETPSTRAHLATLGGVRATKKEALMLAKHGGMIAALGPLPPTALTFRNVSLEAAPIRSAALQGTAHTPGIGFVLDYGVPILSAWLKLQRPALRWRFHLEEQAQPYATALIVKAMLGILQLTVEQVQFPMRASLEYLKDTCALAIWEDMERSIRDFAPGMACAPLHPSMPIRLPLSSVQPQAMGSASGATVLAQALVDHQPHTGAPPPVDYVFQLTHDALYAVQQTEASAEDLARSGEALQQQLLMLRARMQALESESGHTPFMPPPVQSIEQLFGPYGKTYQAARPLLTRQEAESHALQFVHDAIVQAGAASEVAAQSARHVQFLQGQVNALGHRINELATRLGTPHFDWMQSMYRGP